MSTDLIQKKTMTMRGLLERSKKEIEMALPKHLTADRMLRIALTELRKNPKLADCTEASFLGSIVQCAQLGLEPGSGLGHAFLVPFKNNKLGITEVQLIIGYKGFIDLAGRSEKVSHTIARVVYDGDEFDYAFGTSEFIKHNPKEDADQNKPTHFYAIFFLTNGRYIFDVISHKKMLSIRDQINPKKDGPWFTDYLEMGKKTVVRGLFKFAPVSIEVQRAVGYDESGDRGEQDNSIVFETEGKTISETDGKNAAANAAESLKGKGPAIRPLADDVLPQEGLFANTEDPKKPAPKKEMTMGEMEKEIMAICQHLNLSEKDLGDICQEITGKTPSNVNKEDLKKLLAALEEKARG